MEGFFTEYEFLVRASTAVARYGLNSGRNYEDLDIERARKLFRQECSNDEYSYKFDAGIPSQLPADVDNDVDMVDITSFNLLPCGFNDDDEMIGINGLDLLGVKDLADDTSVDEHYPLEIVDLTVDDIVEDVDLVDLTNDASDTDETDTDSTSEGSVPDYYENSDTDVSSDTDDFPDTDDFSDSTDIDSESEAESGISGISSISSGCCSNDSDRICCLCSKCLNSD